MRKTRIGAMVVGVIWFLAIPLLAREVPLQAKDAKPLSKESFDESVRLLGKSGQYINYPAISSRKYPASFGFVQTLSSPRVRKVLDEIGGPGRSDKSLAKCEMVFKQTFTEYKQVADAVLKHYEVPGTPSNKKSLYPRTQAVCAGILCFAELGDTDAVLKKLETVDAFIDKTKDRITANAKTFPKHFEDFTECFLRPRNIYRFNVLLYSCSQNNKAQCEKIVKDLKIPVGTWVNIAEWHEFPRRPRHPANRDLAEPIKMVIAYDWPKSVGDDSEKQRALLERLRKLVRPAGKLK